MTILSMTLVLLAIFLYEQFIDFTQIILRPKTEIFSTQRPKNGDFQYSAACLSIICESFLLNGIIVECCLMLNKNVYMNMNYSYPPTMYEFLVDLHFLAHLSRRLIGELIGYSWSGVRP